MLNLNELDEKDSMSDSTLSTSVSGDLLCQRPKFAGRSLIAINSIPRSLKLAPKPRLSYRVGRKPSPVQCLEKQPFVKRKSQRCSHTKLCLSPNPVTRKKPKTLLFRNESSPESGFRGKEDIRKTVNSLYNQTQIVYPAMVGQAGMGAKANAAREAEALGLDPQSFPFKCTPSGNYKLKPSQVVYESKNLSIVAADPKVVTLNVSESCKDLEAKPCTKPDNDNWDTTCIYSAVGAGGQIMFGSEFSDTFSESEGAGLFQTGKNVGKSSELNLAKMGYVMDNCIDWKRLSLPKKSDLQKLMMEHILNVVNPDIQIKIGSHTYNCHRIVLQCYCTYFISKTSPVVELPETSVSGEVFSLVYQWMLHLDTDSYLLLRRDNILSIFKASNFLGIKELQAQCWAFIDNTEIFAEDKAFLLYLEARQQNNKDIMELMVPRIQRFFLTLVSSKEFVEFSLEEVCTFLRSNYICIHCEMEVFMAGVRWLSHDWQGRRPHIVEVMRCVRFGFINPKILITIKRNPQSPEFLRVSNIPEVSKMIDDGLALLTLKVYLENESEEEVKKNLKSLGLSDPVPRNWAGTSKNYQNYSEFLHDLGHYRSKQKIEIKRSKMEIEINQVQDDDFLASAVLPPASQQKIKKLNNGKCSLGSVARCIPQLEPKELDLIKRMICKDESLGEGKRGVMKPKLYSQAKDEYNKKPTKKKTVKEANVKRKLSPHPRAFTHQDREVAARKIQKYYRQYSVRKSSPPFGEQNVKSDPRKQDTHRGYQKNIAQSQERNENLKARSDPSLSGLLKSSIYPPRTLEEDIPPLQGSSETVFVFGGSDPFQETHHDNNGQKIYKYQTSNNSWVKCGEMPEPRHFHCALYFQGKIYIAGGKNPCKLQQDALSRKVWQFDPDYKAWSRVKDMLHARRSFGFVTCNNKMFVVGGRNDQDRVIGLVERYDTESDCWVEVRSLLTGRAGAAVCEHQGRVWVAGGMINQHDQATNSVEYYEPHQNLWVPCVGLRYTVAYGALVSVTNRLYLVGGALGLLDSELSGSGKHVDVWDPESQSWCLASMMKKPRHAHSATYLRLESGQGLIFILGGMSTRHNNVTESVECWQEEDDHWVMGVSPLPHPLSGHTALTLPMHTMP